MVALSGHERAWYWTPAGVLRACFVVELDVVGSVERVVIDAETLASVNVRPEDVMIEKPE